jgi:cytochrome b subunit of formate dehydrogenase
VSPPRYVRRFSRSERALHWVHASAFFVLLGSGLVLYLPSLATEVGRRPLVKDVHLLTALGVDPRPGGGHRPRRPPGAARHDA